MKVAPLLNVHRTEDQLKAKTVRICLPFLRADHFPSLHGKRDVERSIILCSFHNTK